MLRVSNLNVAYGKLQVLWNVSLEVREGELVSLIGPNGAGKTTLLRTISGLLKPISGTIEFMGRRIDGLPPHKICKLGLIHIPEGRGIFPLMSVLENLQMGAYTGELRKRFERNVKEVFRLFPVLSERLGQVAETLSGGEMQMLSIGRGLIAEPKLLMLDEPTIGLAPKLSELIFDSISKLHEEGLTILLVSQEVRRALELADRAYVMENGRIVLEGTGEELLENPNIKKSYLGL